MNPSGMRSGLHGLSGEWAPAVMRFAKFLLLGSLLVIGNGQSAAAMEIAEFDRLGKRQSDYIAHMVNNVVELLKRQKRINEAAHMIDLFTGASPGSATSRGMLQFSEVLETARLADLKRAAKGHERLHVEDALLVMLKRKEIILNRDDVRDAVHAGAKKAGFGKDEGE